MSLPPNYAERVYAGVLGKIIGVYLGRPFEGWTHERIMEELGEIDGYVNHRVLGKPALVVTDDDISGTFTFLRALPDHGNSPDLTSDQIGDTWLNYIIEGRTTLWWGGFGNSTEHTAFLHLRDGVPAPESGSIARNGRLIAEQIGAQIFIDGWAMVAPGDPQKAAALARRAARVSHDGEAVHAAAVLAAMEAQAFVEHDIQQLLDVGVSVIPRDAHIYRLIADVRAIHATEPDWRTGRARMVGPYNYETFGGNCHMIPNHGLVILGLLYGEGDFARSMQVVNTSGWDTDCNAGNLGCLLGIRAGLSVFRGGEDWRGPVADRLFLPSADGGRAITDAVIEAQEIANTGRALAGDPPVRPKQGARFHFEFPGSMQGFRPAGENTRLENVPGHSRAGQRTLEVRFDGPARLSTPTFILPHEMGMAGYALLASPTLYSGQNVRTGFSAERAASVRLFARAYSRGDRLADLYGPEIQLAPGDYAEPVWQIPDTRGWPVAEIGLEIAGGSGRLHLDYLRWDGTPNVNLTRPFGLKGSADTSQAWRRAWVDAVDQWDPSCSQAFCLVQNDGRGLIMQGTRDWQDYEVEADITPWLVEAAGIGARVQGLRRFYALQLAAGKRVRLLKALDGDQVLAEQSFDWDLHRTYQMKLQVAGSRVRAWIDSLPLFEVEDRRNPLLGGAVAYVVDRGHIRSRGMRVGPLADPDRPNT